MEVGFQKFLQLFVANGYCVLKTDICVDLPDVLGGSLIVPIPLFQDSSLGLGDPLSQCLPESQRSRCVVETRGVIE